jgi:hypothetical protein
MQTIQNYLTYENNSELDEGYIYVSGNKESNITMAH